MKNTAIMCGGILWGALLLTSCQGFREADSAKNVAPLTVSVRLNVDVESLSHLKDMKVSLDDYADGYHYERMVEGGSVLLDNIIPGLYTISVSGTAYNANDEEFFVKGNLVNKALYDGVTDLTVNVQGLKVSPLIFKEIYYCGSKPPVGWGYFKDQFYEVYNNSAEIQYLDGIYFAHLYPTNATQKLPVWPESDGQKYCYAERVWKFPGTGKQYPLRSGESAVIAQFAANHKLEIYNPNSPVDCSRAEFEFNVDNPSYPDQPALDMVHVFYDGKADKGNLKQYLTPVFGAAYIIFRVPEGETWDPVNDSSLVADDLSTATKIERKAKIPIRYVLDAVEAVNNESKSDSKRIPAVLDAGVTYVGDTYIGLSVARKVAMEGDKILRRDNGAIILVDTNDSTNDFERGLVPQLHRYGTGVPVWNVTK